MQGSLRQRSAGSFELRVFIGVDPATARRRYRSVTVRGSRAEAERELSSMVASACAVRSVGARSSVSELVEAWFATASAGWSPTTIRQTRSVLDRDVHPHLGQLGVGDVTAAAIDAVYATLRRSGGVGERPLASGTLARIHVVVRAAFAQAMRWGWIWDNPAERARRIVATTVELRPPTPAELRTLLDHVAARDGQLHVFLVLAAFTGARRAQLLGLRWRNVHLDTRQVSFRAGWVEGPDGPVLAPTKTNRSHVVDLDLHRSPSSPLTPSNEAASPMVSCSATTAASRRGNRTGSPKRSSAIDAPLVCVRSGCTICGTSWPPKCSTPASRSSSCPAGSIIVVCRQRSTRTPTPSPGGDAQASAISVLQARPQTKGLRRGWSSGLASDPATVAL